VPRVISFIVLLAIVLLVGAVFFQVMAQFIVPLFLACVLLVVFQPLHRWVLRNFPTYPRVAALITTFLILLVVLLPLVWLGWNAYVELHGLFAPERGPKSAVAASGDSADTANETAASDAPTAQEQELKQDEIAFSKKVNKEALTLRDKLHQISSIYIQDNDVESMLASGQRFLATKALSGVQTIIGILIGLAIMVIALYYFLADGPVMIETVMDFSPLDYNYEQELLARFGDVSRAVVVATLLSAVVQGTLAGVGYSLALSPGSPIFLLTVLTMATALVPFVGAAAVWICVCAWVYLYGERVVDGSIVQGDPRTAIILAIYCTIVVSGIDNVIKPLVLHGQSKLHPLLALLSILGGVQVLGPVGILVGPMLVSFLQALLNMLRKELASFGGTVVDGSTPLAESSTGAIQKTGDENDDKAAKLDAQPAPGAKAVVTGAKAAAGGGKLSRARQAKRKR
jgi:predicted PurR-regulated permease PerM